MQKPRGELPERYKLESGWKGKSLFVAGSNDDAQASINQLEQTVGHGNYDDVAMAPGMF